MKESKRYIFANKKERRKLGLIPVTLFLVVIMLAAFLSGNYIATKGIFLVNMPSQDVVSAAKQINDKSKYSALFTVRDTLLEKYDGEIDDNKLLVGAIKGMTNSLGDPYTVFKTPEEFQALIKESNGNVTHIGITVAAKDQQLVVVETVKGGPADKAGIIANDVIEKVNDVEVSGNDIDKAVALISTSNDTGVKLTIKRANAGEIEIKLVGDTVKTEPVIGNMLNESIGYIRIKTFNDENTADNFKNTIDQLKSQGMKGLILDLRENPGGLLSQAVKVASQFIPKDKIITYTIDKYDNRYDSLSIGGDAEGMPLVLLVNKNSASASEVVTGALRDYKAATLVGKTTFGKGITQLPIQLKDNIGGLKVTISKYYTPNGENIHNIGIKPDFEVETAVGIDETGYDKNTDEQLKTAIQKIEEKLQ
ncbi:carboxyl-terminal processing protease [Clostridium saccharoperbutylacetonicum]|uniref:Carboxyl-terminal protease n=1 Tax=Clostridium saccharoperbutylacetonicum N1-4(HMT) TaxID=931276 RepID=M1M138_9CLOT|nr:S41 family peptidase [Clostridium saccharoperbutylacetonicum]AGF59265.1 carboxyl-terminal protease [Clostridium saccharoperbutylacetonicum N1-4(HMT)]NRT59947.1 carboxyl-terminal processing protease [Clostridium saccharoperbutylacetonicum]NSB23259.1 carboxyl-terminal processing protease [Clostridium saccharoperbutylacetonicum]NSB42629.1 carboxyl-terminal processing protease [Clostridium saccharoperbutylacetonicum]